MLSIDLDERWTSPAELGSRRKGRWINSVSPFPAYIYLYKKPIYSTWKRPQKKREEEEEEEVGNVVICGLRLSF